MTGNVNLDVPLTDPLVQTMSVGNREIPAADSSTGYYELNEGLYGYTTTGIPRNGPTYEGVLLPEGMDHREKTKTRRLIRILWGFFFKK